MMSGSETKHKSKMNRTKNSLSQAEDVPWFKEKIC